MSGTYFKFHFITVALVSLSGALMLGEPALAVTFSPPQSKQEFCAKISDPNYTKNLTIDGQNLIAFSNPAAGIGNAGVCWWHSQLQRSALFLTVYRPDLPKPNEAQAQHLFAAIMKQTGVVEVPGFSNFGQFTQTFAKSLVAQLERWQMTQGVFGFSWVNGVNSDETTSDNLKKLMDELYDQVENKHQIVYQTLKMPGVVAHAWLVVQMKRKNDGGYQLFVLDSNYFGLQSWSYLPGMTHFNYGSMSFVPYTNRMYDLDAYKTLAQDYCSQPERTGPTPQVGDDCGGAGHLEDLGDSGNLTCVYPGGAAHAGNGNG